MRFSITLSLVILLALPAFAQHPALSQEAPPEITGQQLPDPQFGGRPRQDAAEAEHAAHEQMKSRNEARQKALQNDTDRLLKLATELKQYVDRTNENVLSIDVIRKAEQVEKLAKSIREKMKAD